MQISKLKLMAGGLVVAVAAAGMAIASPGVKPSRVGATADQQTGAGIPAQTGVKRSAQNEGGRAPQPHQSVARVEIDPNVSVEAPHTRVNVQKDDGKVRVQAPYTDVKVDPDAGRIRVRAPYVNLDIKW